MGKSDRKAAVGMVNQNQQNISQRSGQIKGMLDPALQEQMQNANQLGGQIKDTYTGMTGPTGAYDPNEYKSISGNNADLRSRYQSLADTGGISEDTANAMRRQTASGVQSVYATAGANLARQKATQPGGGGGGETAEMARQVAQEQAKGVTGVNAQIGQLRQQGTIAGLEGIGNVNRAQQDLASGAAQQKIQAAGGLQQLYSSDPGYVHDLLQNIQQEYATTGQLSEQNANIMQEISKQPGLFSTIMGSVGAVGSLAGGVGGLISGVKK